MSYQIERQMEREEDHLDRQLSEGKITMAEYNKEIKELRREYREMARDAAEQAYREEMGRW